jgi:hypothetical protein
MPVPSMAFAFGTQMIIIDIMRYFGYKAPIRISSLPRGSELRPGIYSIIEDVCAVDGSGGTEFRQRLNLRYQASHYFRQMLHRLTLFWAFGALAIATVTTALVFTVNRNVAYVVSLPTFAALHQIADLSEAGMDCSIWMGSGLGSAHHALRSEESEKGTESMGRRASESIKRPCHILFLFTNSKHTIQRMSLLRD